MVTAAGRDCHAISALLEDRYALADTASDHRYHAERGVLASRPWWSGGACSSHAAAVSAGPVIAPAPAEWLRPAGRRAAACRGASVPLAWAAALRRPARGAAGTRSGRSCCAARRRPIWPGAWWTAGCTT